jgi:hypothetical protein
MSQVESVLMRRNPQIFWRENLKERENVEDKGVDGKPILKEHGL